MVRTAGKAKAQKTRRAKPARKSARVPDIVEMIQSLGRMIPEEELRRIPKDLSSQVDHYVYGLPKR
jgi:hypothetical protein